MSQLEEFLAEQAGYPSAGAGAFTLDPARQRDMLVRLGLSDTDLGFLKLAQGACGAGSPWLRFDTDGVELKVAFQPLREPRQPLWEGDDLAVGLLGLSQEYSLEWNWAWGDLEVQGQVRDNHFQESRRQSTRTESSLSLRIKKLKPRWWQRSWTARAQKLLARRLRCSPLEVTWNGVPLNGPLYLSNQAEAWILSPPGEPAGLWLCLDSRAPYRRVRCGQLLGDEALSTAESRETSSQMGYCGWAALGAHRSSWSETTFVLRGVALERESNLLDRPGIAAVVSAEGLTPGLGGLQLVHDQAFRDRLQSLREEVRWLDEINQSKP